VQSPERAGTSEVVGEAPRVQCRQNLGSNAKQQQREEVDVRSAVAADQGGAMRPACSSDRPRPYTQSNHAASFLGRLAFYF